MRYLRDIVKVKDLATDTLSFDQLKSRYFARLKEPSQDHCWPVNGLASGTLSEYDFNIKKEYQVFFNRTRADQLMHLQLECIHINSFKIDDVPGYYISEYLVCAGFTVFVFDRNDGEFVVLNHIQFDEFLAGKFDVFASVPSHG